MAEKKKIEFTHDDAQDIANDISRSLMLNVTSINGNTAEILTTLNMVQALVVKNVLVLMGDPLNMARADTIFDMSASKSKEVIRGLSTRIVN